MRKLKTYFTRTYHIGPLSFDVLYNIKCWRFGFGFQFTRYLWRAILFCGPFEFELDHWRNVRVRSANVQRTT